MTGPLQLSNLKLRLSKTLTDALNDALPEILASVEGLTAAYDELNLLDGVAGLVQADFTKLAALTASADQINYTAVTTPGTQEASKAVVADANINTGVSKVTELHIGGTGAEAQVTATPATLNVSNYDAGGHAVANIDFNAAGAAAMTVTIGGVVYQEADAEDLPNGVWTNGASAADSAASLLAAINGDTRAAVPFTAVADISTAGVWIVADAAGTAGNVALASSAGTATVPANTAGGAAAAQKQTCRIKHTVTAQQLLSGGVDIPLPFAPDGFTMSCFTAAGLMVVPTDLVTIATAPNRLRIDTDGATNLGDTNVVYIHAWT